MNNRRPSFIPKHKSPPSPSYYETNPARLPHIQIEVQQQAMRAAARVRF